MTATAAQIVPNTGKQYWLDLVRMEVVNRAQLSGTTHIGEVHKMIIDGKLPAPLNVRWMSEVFRAPYFSRSGVMAHTDKKVYANSKITNLYRFDYGIFMSRMSIGRVSPRMNRLLTDVRGW